MDGVHVTPTYDSIDEMRKVLIVRQLRMENSENNILRLKLGQNRIQDEIQIDK